MTPPPSNPVQSTQPNSGSLVDRLRREAFRDDDVLIDTMSIIFEAADRIAELESNERAYEEIIGPMTYREVADRIKDLEVALQDIARQNTTDQMCEAEVEGSDFENAYDIIIGRARAALQPKESGG